MKSNESSTKFIIDENMVKHVAFLVRLKIQDEEAITFGRQFSTIIEYFRLLNEVDTENIPPANEHTNGQNHLRIDQICPSMTREEFFANVPLNSNAYVKVPRVFEEE